MDKLSSIGYDTSNLQKRVDINVQDSGLVVVDNPDFFKGQEFRTFYEFSTTKGTQIPASNRVLFKVVIGANNMMLESLDLSIDDGTVRATSHLGGVITGAFVTTQPIIPANSATGTPAFTATTVITATAAGLAAAVNITGSSERDVIRIKTPSGGGASSSGNSPVDSVRGLPALATFHILVENTGVGNAEGVIKLRWIERAP